MNAASAPTNWNGSDVRVLNKKLLRGMWQAKGQAIAIAAVVLCGAATFISFASAHRNLLLTRDTYYQQYRFAEFEIQLERAPLTAVLKLEELEGVRRARGRIVKEVNLDIPYVDEARSGRIISMPEDDRDVINDIVIMEGGYFGGGGTNEVILSRDFARANDLEVGDSIEASIEERKYPLEIVGIALSPEYVYVIGGQGDMIPNPERFGVLWVTRDFAETAADMEEACNNVVGMVSGEQSIDTVLEKAEDLLDPYGVFATTKQEDQVSNQFLSDEIEGLKVSATITPAIFLGVAALILYVLLNRMVRNERTQIGLLKAYGYSSWEVSLHYIKYAVLLGVIGCALGVGAGQWLANGMIRLYVEFYQFPLLRSRLYPDIVARSFAITVGFSVAGAVAAARHAARIQPAEAMRPEAPKYAARSILESAAFIWTRLSFTWKMIIRNVARYRLRAGITILGVSVAAALMVVGFFTMDSMNYMIQYQFNEIQRHDVRVTLASERGRDALYELERLAGVRAAEPQLQYPFRVRNNWREKEIGVVGLPPDSELHHLIDDEGRRTPLPETGLVVNDKLAEQLHLKAGDRVAIEPLMGRIEGERAVTVQKVVKEYFGGGAYMSIAALSRILEEPFAMNTALLRTDPGAERAISRTLKDAPRVAGVEIKADALENIQATLQESMSIMSGFLALFSGVIAFAIIYNATIVSLAERERELASLRVMGFTKGEVGAIVYNENFLLSAIGLVLGIPLGLLLCRMLVEAYDMELYRLPFYVEQSTFITTAVLTVVFVILANLAAWRRIHKLDLIETLKSRE
jgi:putative ABC transport system permease protein